jgi:hypothetical protein
VVGTAFRDDVERQRHDDGQSHQHELQPEDRIDRVALWPRKDEHNARHEQERQGSPGKRQQSPREVGHTLAPERQSEDP